MLVFLEIALELIRVFFTSMYTVSALQFCGHIANTVTDVFVWQAVATYQRQRGSRVHKAGPQRHSKSD